MDLSIVIPVFNEGEKIREDIASAAVFLKGSGLKGEILIVDDGSSDNTAQVAMETQVPCDIEKTVLHYEQNKGKGYAVKTGIKLTKGQYVTFVDSGLCTDYRFVQEGMRLLSLGMCDLAYGSRYMPQSIIVKPQHWSRRFASKVFRRFVLSFLDIPRHLTDTQCGFKLYKGEIARELYGECKTDGFTFDIEIILRAQQKGYRIVEFPIEWRSDHDSRLRPLRMVRQVFPELLAIQRELSKDNSNVNPQ